MREQIARILNNWKLSQEQTLDQILALFREEISKLKPLSDEEIERAYQNDCNCSACTGTRVRKIAQAQLDHSKKALLEKLEEK